MCALLASGPRAPASARDAGLPDPSRELELIESTESRDDPLSLDEITGSGLDRAAAMLPKQTRPVSLPTAQLGSVLSAIDGVRETAHTLAVRLEQGLAHVQATMRFSSRAKHAAALAYRFSLPDGAVVHRVALCRGGACTDASPGGGVAARDDRMQLNATPITDARGHALSLMLSPIAPGATLELHIALVAPAPLHGGRVRFRLPPRGEDPRIATTEVRVSSTSLVALSPGSALESDPAFPLSITAQSAEGAGPFRTSTRAPCGRGTCLRQVESVGLVQPRVRETWLWIDASPSMEGPARGRADAVLTALLSILPEETPLEVFAFAARGIALGAHRAGDVPLDVLAEATMQQLGSATHPSSLVALTRPDVVRAHPRIVLITDGQLDTVEREQDALRTLRARSESLWLAHVGDTAPRLTDPFDAGHRVLSLAALADDAMHTGDLAALSDALRVLSMPARAGVSPGEQRVREERPRRPFSPSAGAHWLTFWMTRDQPLVDWSIGAPASPGTIAAPPFSSSPEPARKPDTGMPKESVLAMLRTQLVPAARACLQTDRRGRADYAVELTFHALFAAREVFDARIEGAIPRALSACLTEILPRLSVPAFTGRIRVHYPIHTEREATAPVIELEPELARELDRAFSPGRALP